MTQSSVGVSFVSVLIVTVASSDRDPNLALFPPPRRFLVPLSREGDASPFNKGPNSISDGDPLFELLTDVGRGKRDGGIGRL